MSTSLCLLDHFGEFAESHLVVLLELEDDHVQINIIGSVPVRQAQVGLLFDFGHRIRVPQLQQVLRHEDYDVAPPLHSPLLLRQP